MDLKYSLTVIVIEIMNMITKIIVTLAMILNLKTNVYPSIIMMINVSNKALNQLQCNWPKRLQWSDSIMILQFNSTHSLLLWGPFPPVALFMGKHMLIQYITFCSKQKLWNALCLPLLAPSITYQCALSAYHGVNSCSTICF